MDIRELSAALQSESVVSSFGSIEGVFGGSDNLPDGSHFVLIATNSTLNLLRTSTYIGCFNTLFSPSASQQWWVHTIFTVKNTVMLQCCWFLFQNESQDMYDAMLTSLRAKLRTWQFTFVICDENVLQSDAYKTVFGVQIVTSVHQNVINVTRLAATHTAALMHIPVHWDKFKRIIKLCCALQFLPRSLILRGLSVVKKEAMNCDNQVFDRLWPIIQVIASPPHNFLVYGCPDKSNYAREILAGEMNKVCRAQQYKVQRFIGEILRMVKTTIEDQHLLLLGRRPLRARPSRICSALSENAEIGVLTRGITRPTMNIDYLILNFLLNVSQIVLRYSGIYESNVFF